MAKEGRSGPLGLEEQENENAQSRDDVHAHLRKRLAENDRIVPNCAQATHEPNCDIEQGQEYGPLAPDSFGHVRTPGRDTVIGPPRMPSVINDEKPGAQDDRIEAKGIICYWIRRIP
jgi:hypothetical protein